MNLVLFEASEVASPLLRSDLRASHVLEVLRRGPGDEFDVGMVDGPRGKARVEAVSTAEILLTFKWGPALPALPDLALIIGLPRPQTARKILQEVATFGVSQVHFVRTERAEPQYASSTLWSSGEWRRHVLAGVAQAFDTRMPKVSWNQTLGEVLGHMSGHVNPLDVQGNQGAESARIALDNYEAECRLSECSVGLSAAVVLALGPERGWGPADRRLLRDHHFILAHLGERVLRTETATLAGLAILAAKKQWM